MSRSDYSHWNEDADWMWWQEEGRHPYEPPELDDYNAYDRPRVRRGVCTWCDNEEVHCEICGEHIKHEARDIAHFIEEAAEFWDATEERGVLAHAQCGIDAGMELA